MDNQEKLDTKVEDLYLQDEAAEQETETQDAVNQEPDQVETENQEKLNTDNTEEQTDAPVVESFEEARSARIQASQQHNAAEETPGEEEAHDAPVEGSLGTEPAEGVEYGLKNEDYYDMDVILARISERKKAQLEKKKRERLKARLIFGGIAAVIIMIILSFTSIFTVDNIEVEGNSYFAAEEIINMGHAAPGKNLIYHPDKKTIVDYLEANPYIKSAKVGRRLPSTLVIKVEERKPVAAIKYADEFLIIDNEGILLRKTKSTPKITILEGVVIRKIVLGEKVEVKDEDTMEKAMNVLNLMKQHDLYFVRLSFEDHYVKASIYEALVCKGTYSQLVDGLEKDKLHSVLEELFSEGIKRGTITFSDEGYVSFEPTVY